MLDFISIITVSPFPPPPPAVFQLSCPFVWPCYEVGRHSLDEMGHVANPKPIGVARRMEYANWPGLERPGGDAGEVEEMTEMGVVGCERAVASLWVPGWETGTSASIGNPLCHRRCAATA